MIPTTSLVRRRLGAGRSSSPSSLKRKVLLRFLRKFYSHQDSSRGNQVPPQLVWVSWDLRQIWMIFKLLVKKWDLYWFSQSFPISLTSLARTFWGAEFFGFPYYVIIFIRFHVVLDHFHFLNQRNWINFKKYFNHALVLVSFSYQLDFISE